MDTSSRLQYLCLGRLRRWLVGVRKLRKLRVPGSTGDISPVRLYTTMCAELLKTVVVDKRPSPRPRRRRRPSSQGARLKYNSSTPTGHPRRRHEPRAQCARIAPSRLSCSSHSPIMPLPTGCARCRRRSHRRLGRRASMWMCDTLLARSGARRGSRTITNLPAVSTIAWGAIVTALL